MYQHLSKLKCICLTLCPPFQLSQYVLNNTGIPMCSSGLEQEQGNHQEVRYEDLKNYEVTPRYEGSQQYEGYEVQQQLECGNMATLPMRAAIPLPEGHIIVNPYSTQHPYSTQLVDNINRMMVGGQQVPVSHIYQVAMSPQLSLLTNTLRKKKCLGGHPGPCHHNSPHHSDMSQHSDSLTPPPTTETELLPGSAEVVFRAVSPHGHVYWEIDPKRPNKLQSDHPSDEDTTNDLHNMSDFSEDDGKVLSDRSRQSSSRFSDHRPLISSSPAHRTLLAPLPEAHLSPSHRELRFNSLQKAQPQQPSGFSTRTRLRAGRAGGRESAQEQSYVPEQLQQQVQIPDLRRMPVTVKSSEYIMAKIQDHMEQRSVQRGPAGGQKERQV